MKAIIENYIRAWNSLDVQGIADYLHDDIEYHSQVVLEELKGTIKVQDYLTKKFDATRKGDQAVRMYLGKYQNNYCAAIFQLLNKPESNRFASGKGNRKMPYRSCCDV